MGIWIEDLGFRIEDLRIEELGLRIGGFGILGLRIEQL